MFGAAFSHLIKKTINASYFCKVSLFCDLKKKIGQAWEELPDRKIVKLNRFFLSFSSSVRFLVVLSFHIDWLQKKLLNEELIVPIAFEKFFDVIFNNKPIENLFIKKIQ